VLSACGGGDGTGPDGGVNLVEISGGDRTLDVGQSVQLTARVLDSNGALISGESVDWNSSSPSVATVSTSGNVMALTEGTTQITATAGGRSGSANVMVTVPIAITGIAPVPLRAGQAATITGTGFSGNAPTNNVSISGQIVTVTVATTTSLQIQVPQNACLPAGNVSVDVTTAGRSASSVQPFDAGGAGPVQVALGQQLIITDPFDFCLRFDETAVNESYLIGLQSVASVVTSVTSARITGTSAVGVAAPVLAAPDRPRSGPFAISAQPIIRSPAAVLRARHRAAEAAMRRENARWLRFMGRPDYSRRDELAAVSIPPVVTVGQQIPIRVPQSCSAFTEITAVVRVVGQKGVWLEDVANPTGGFTIADFQAASDEMDARAYDVVVNHFGAPTDLDGNGRVVVVVTKEVNRRSDNTLGFVHPADVFPRGAGQNQCLSSDAGEIYYSRAPDTGGQFGAVTSLAVMRDNLIPTFVHEFVHILQTGRRFTNPQFVAFQQPWEFEGQALISEEIYGHQVTSRMTGQNYGFGVSFAGTEFPDVDPDPYGWYFDKFFDMFFYFGLDCDAETCDRDLQIAGAPEQCSWLNDSDAGNTGPCVEWREFYGVPWSIFRWIADQYGPGFPGGEAGLMRAFIDHPGAGFNTLADVTGVAVNQLLAQWAATLYTDDRFAGMDPRLQMTSWNLTAFAGPEGVQGPLIPTVWLRPRLRTFGPFIDQVQVRGGSTSYFRVSGARPAFALSARSTAGATLPGHLQLWIVRVQ
jgi:hypothetical protein